MDFSSTVSTLIHHIYTQLQYQVLSMHRQIPSSYLNFVLAVSGCLNYYYLERRKHFCES